MERAVVALNVLSFIAAAAFAPYVLFSGIVVNASLFFAKPDMALLAAVLMTIPTLLPCLCLVLSLWATRRGSKIAPFIAGLPLALFVVAQINPSTSYF